MPVHGRHGAWTSSQSATIGGAGQARRDSGLAVTCLFANGPDPSPERQMQERPDFSQRAEKQVSRLRGNLPERSVAAQIVKERNQILLEDAALQHLKLRAPERGPKFRPRVLAMVTVVDPLVSAHVEEIVEIVVRRVEPPVIGGCRIASRPVERCVQALPALTACDSRPASREAGSHPQKAARGRCPSAGDLRRRAPPATARAGRTLTTAGTTVPARFQGTST